MYLKIANKRHPKIKAPIEDGIQPSIKAKNVL